MSNEFPDLLGEYTVRLLDMAGHSIYEEDSYCFPNTYRINNLLDEHDTSRKNPVEIVEITATIVRTVKVMERNNITGSFNTIYEKDKQR